MNHSRLVADVTFGVMAGEGGRSGDHTLEITSEFQSIVLDSLLATVQNDTVHSARYAW